MTYADLGDEIRRFEPHLVGISAISNEAKQVHRISAVAKTQRPDSVVVVGGPYATSYTQRVMGDPHIDYAVIGEGELTCDDLVSALRQGKSTEGIDGLAYRRNESVVVTPKERMVMDLDALPPPAWDLVPVHKYKHTTRVSHTGHGDYMTLFTSRACPYRCIYCHSMFGKKFRACSPERVLEEIRYLYTHYRIREFEIVDDIFNWDLDRAKRILDMIIESGMKIHITFPNAIRGDRADHEFFVKARKAGTTLMAFAVETASPRLQRLLKKYIKLEKIKENIGFARKTGILCQGFFMLGFPTETREELQMTVDFAVNSDLHACHFFVVNAYEGTGLADLARQVGKPVHSEFGDGYLTEGFTNLTNVSAGEFDRIRRQGLRRFWLSPKRIWRLLRDYPYKSQLPDLAMTFVQRLLVKA
jgi:radical SAM superfamily enzyme YgiQ (UPF0313 family)